MEFGLHRGLRLEQPLVALTLDGLWHVVGKRPRRRVRPRRELEDEGLREAHLANEGERRLEVGLALAGEADDEVGSDRDLWPDDLARHGADLAVALHRVAAPHRLEHAVGACLRRHVKILAHLGQGGDLAQDRLAHERWVRGDEADARESVHVVNRFEQVAEVRATGQALAPAVDGLAEKCHFFDAVAGKPFHFIADLGDRARGLLAAGARHDAVGAAEIAPIHDGHVGAVARGAHGDIAAQIDRRGEVGVDDRRTLAFEPIDRRPEFADLARAEDDIDVRCAREQFVFVVLRHTAEHADDQIGVAPLAAREFAEARPHLVLRLLAHAAGVEEDEFGSGAIGGRFPAACAKLPGGELAVEHVHLATDGFDI